MKRIIVTAILTVVFAVGTVTSFITNDLSNVTQWMQTNEAQFKKPPKHDRPREGKDKKEFKESKDVKKHKDGKDKDHHTNHGPMNGDPQGQPMNPPPGAPMNGPEGNMSPQSMPMQGAMPDGIPQNNMNAPQGN